MLAAFDAAVSFLRYFLRPQFPGFPHSFFLVFVLTYFRVFCGLFSSCFLLIIPNLSTMFALEPNSQKSSVPIYTHPFCGSKYHLYVRDSKISISISDVFLNSRLLCPKNFVCLESPVGYIKAYQININKTELLTFRF